MSRTQSLSLILTVWFIWFNASDVHAQAFKHQDIFIGLALGMGPTPVGVFNRPFGAFQADAEYAVHKYLSVGAYGGAGIKRAQDVRYNLYGMGIKGGWHFWTMISDKMGGDIGEDVIDIYLNISFGFEHERYAVSLNNFGEESRSDYFLGPTIGVRFIPFDHAGFFVEGGKGAMGFLFGGLVIRLY